MAEVKIMRAEETVELSATGELLRKAVYRYTIDGMGPFEVRVDLIDDVPDKIRAIIDKKIATLKMLQK